MAEEQDLHEPVSKWKIPVDVFSNGDMLGKEILQNAFPAALAVVADPVASLIDTTFIGHIGAYVCFEWKVPWIQFSRSLSLLLMVKPPVFLVVVGMGSLLSLTTMKFVCPPTIELPILANEVQGLLGKMHLSKNVCFQVLFALEMKYVTLQYMFVRLRMYCRLSTFYEN
ncbi:hypothetical protein ACFX2I_042155 [Malus domestica]